mgnify:CR=1 FL=1
MFTENIEITAGRNPEDGNFCKAENSRAQPLKNYYSESRIYFLVRG